MFHIVLSADENYIPYTAVLITSIVKNTDTARSFKDFCETRALSESCVAHLDFETLSTQEKQEGYVFHILSDSISEQTLEKLKQLEISLNVIYPCVIQTHMMQDSNFKSFPKSGAAHSNFLPYYRLKLRTFVGEEVSRILYLDCDMLCVFDLRELFAINLNGKIIAAIGDCGSKHRKIKFMQNGQKHTHYFQDEQCTISRVVIINI